MSTTAATFFFNAFLKSGLTVLTALFLWLFTGAFAFFAESVGAMPAPALAAIAPSGVVLRGKNHQSLVVEIEVSGLQGKRLWFHLAKIRSNWLGKKQLCSNPVFGLFSGK